MNYKMRNQIKQHGSTQSLIDVVKPQADLLTVATKLGFAVSIVLVISYCSLNRFIPDLKLEDSIVFIWVFCAFSFVIACGTFMGSMSWIWLFGVRDCYFKKKNISIEYRLPKYLDEVWIHIFSAILFLVWILFIVYLFVQPKPSQESLQLLLVFFAEGFIFLMLITAYTSKQLEFKQLIICLAVAILFLFIIPQSRAVLNITFRASAIRQENVDVIVSPNNFNKVQDYAAIYKVPIDYCHLQKSDTYLIRGVTLAWYGIGQTALLAISTTPEQKGLAYTIQIPLKAEGVSPLPILISDGNQSQESDVRKDLCGCVK